MIPTLNDDQKKFEELVLWIKNELGKDTVMHISRYHPMYKMNIESTATETLLSLFEIANSYLDFVYLGNLQSAKGQNTYCPGCKKMVIERSGYYTKTQGIDEMGNCISCKTKVIEHC